ncbi:WXG100 family type VII secretion target [Micromonospora inyonensis]|uniref:WXG100 family type VII secretion target n=1 Tax=Micromonospora inyonensis TaxID=47866 RepID=A0A1C6R7Z4_9ACTN|nr:hypothetical protein [Micromonospora inyonensis]SCL13151.1 hypothetical protein GA0074694_0179 [Micromonospora inyonensis]
MPINMQGIVADEATIKGMVMAFGQAQAEAKNSQANVTAASSNLSAQWQSDSAAPRFQQAVQQWLNGFQKVQQGLDMLNQHMQQYSQVTTTTEDDSALLSGKWAVG